jgi:hypothetical protein
VAVLGESSTIMPAWPVNIPPEIFISSPFRNLNDSPVNVPPNFNFSVLIEHSY